MPEDQPRPAAATTRPPHSGQRLGNGDPDAPSLGETRETLNAPPQSCDDWLEQGPKPSASSQVWVAVELSDSDAAGGAVATRLERAGFARHPAQRELFLRKVLAAPRPLSHMIEALVGSAGLASPRLAVVLGAEEPSLTDLHSQLEDLALAVTRLRAQWLMPLIVSQQVHSVLMPVFDGHGDTVAEESLGRATLPSGEVANASEMFEAAAALELGAHLDRLLRIDAFTSFARAYPFSQPELTVRTGRDALRGNGTLLMSFSELCSSRGIAVARVLIEVEASVLSAGDERTLASLRSLRDAGFGFSLSRLVPGEQSQQLLLALRPERAKLDGVALRVAARDASQQPALLSLADAAVAVGAQVIASGIESSDDLALAQSIGATLFSGFLLCRPRRL